MLQASKRRMLKGVAETSSSHNNNRNVISTTTPGRINSLNALMTKLISSSVDTELDSSSDDSVDHQRRSIYFSRDDSNNNTTTNQHDHHNHYHLKKIPVTNFDIISVNVIT